MKGKKEIILELTPLLDVILIMMFYILMQNSMAAKNQQDEADKQIEAMQESFEAEKDSMRDELAVLGARLDGEKTFEEYVLMVNVTVANQSTDERIMHVMCGDTDESIVYDWDKMNYASNSLKASLDTIIASADKDNPVFVVFSYDNEEIYLRDYEMVQDILGKVGLFENVYIRYMGGEKDE